MSVQARSLVDKGLPWSSDVRWPVVAVEAVLLVGLGGYILLDTTGAAEAALQIIGVVLLAASVMLGAATLKEQEFRLGVFDAFRAGIGVTVGLIATLSWWSDYIETGAARLILGWGLIAYSILHLVGLVAIRGRSGLRPSILAIVGLTLVLGIFLLTSDDMVSAGRMNALGAIFLIFGVLLGGLAYYLYSRNRPATAPQ